MGAFFSSLSTVELILFILAAASTVILVIQIVLMLIGFGDGDADVDGDADFDMEGGAEGLTLFTVKGIIAFFAIGGWVGLAVSRSGAHIAWVLVSAVVSGILALVGVAYLFRLMAKLQNDGSLKHKNAIGHTATVYLTVPPRGNGSGKINVLVQERYIEAEAITMSDEPIPTGSLVKITGIENDVFVVEIIK